MRFPLRQGVYEGGWYKCCQVLFNNNSITADERYLWGDERYLD